MLWRLKLPGSDSSNMTSKHNMEPPSMLRSFAELIKPHLAPLALVIFSLVPLWLLGCLVEIGLVRLWAPLSYRPLKSW